MRRNYYTDEQGFVTVRYYRNPGAASRRHNYWLKLPRDIIATILQKVGVLHTLMSAQLVCTEWRDICNDPSTWTTIRVVDWKSYITPQLNHNEDAYDEFTTHVENMIRRVVDLSCGNLLDLDLDELMSEELLDYVVERSTHIRRLRGCEGDGVEWWFTEDILDRLASRLPLLEVLELDIYNSFSSEAIETLGRYCPRLSSLKTHISGDEIAETIARSMPQLRHICFSVESFVTDVGVEALLYGCPHLESLDIRECYLKCYFFCISGALQTMRNLPLTRTEWRNILDDPSTWSIIRVGPKLMHINNKFEEHVKDIIRRGVDKSCGGLVDLDLNYFMSDDMLGYVIERCNQIRRLRADMDMSFDCSEGAVRAAFASLPLLEDLELDYWVSLSAETIETLRKCCPRLTSLKIRIHDDEEAKTLARCFPQLRHFKPIDSYALTEKGVEALLNGCPNLESLDLRECRYLRLSGTLGVRCAQQIMHLQRHIPYCSWSCGSTEYQRDEDDSDSNQFFNEEEEDVYDVNYRRDRREEHWSRRENARCRETL